MYYCVFCNDKCSTGTTLLWGDSDKSVVEREKNTSFFQTLCRALGISGSDKEFNTKAVLERFSLCEECHKICCELKELFGLIDEKVSELKCKVAKIGTSGDGEEVGRGGISNEADVDRFRAEILKAKKGREECTVFVSSDGFKRLHEEGSIKEALFVTVNVDEARGADWEDEFNEEKLLEEFQIRPDELDELSASARNNTLASATFSESAGQTTEVEEKTVRRKRCQKIASSHSAVSSSKRVKVNQCSTRENMKVPQEFSEAEEKVVEISGKGEVLNDENGSEDDGENRKKEGTSSSRKLPCSICKKFFRKPSLLRRHQQIVHEKQRPYECSICSKGFARKNVYTMHLIHAHETVEEQEKPFSCSICLKKFMLEVLKDRHESFHQFDSTKPLSCPNCDIRFAADDHKGLEKHVQFTHSKRPNNFYCEQCNISFQNRTLKLRHDSQIHLDKFIHECRQCQKRYSIKAFLVTHMKTHSEEGPFRCTVCKWEVLNGDLLAEHLLSHTGEKRLKCGECEERFFSVGELKRHRVYEHGAEKAFECSFCHKRFILNSDRTAHMREVHEGFPNQCICLQCNKGFANPKYLKNHIRKTHEMKRVVVCEICGKRLADTSSLKDHMNSHEGIKPFACSFCDQRFVKKNTLKCHILTHTGEKPFVCHICNKGYTQSHCLKSHLKSHATDNEEPKNSSSTGSSNIIKSIRATSITVESTVTEALEKLSSSDNFIITSGTIGISSSDCITTNVITMKSPINTCSRAIDSRQLASTAVINQPVIVATQSASLPVITVQPVGGDIHQIVSANVGQTVPISIPVAVATTQPTRINTNNQVFAVDQVSFASMFPNL